MGRRGRCHPYYSIIRINEAKVSPERQRKFRTQRSAKFNCMNSVDENE
jgi:hypothetical protein